MPFYEELLKRRYTPFALIKQLEIRRLYASKKIIPKKLIVGGKLESW